MSMLIYLVGLAHSDTTPGHSSCLWCPLPCTGRMSPWRQLSTVPQKILYMLYSQSFWCSLKPHKNTLSSTHSCHWSGSHMQNRISEQRSLMLVLETLPSLAHLPPSNYTLVLKPKDLWRQWNPYHLLPPSLLKMTSSWLSTNFSSRQIIKQRWWSRIVTPLLIIGLIGFCLSDLTGDHACLGHSQKPSLMSGPINPPQVLIG